MPIIVSFSIMGLDNSPSVGHYVKIATQVLEKSGVDYITGPMETSFEARDIAHAFLVVKKAHDAVVAAGAKRVIIHMKVDNRLDKEQTMARKIKRASLD